MTTHPDAPRPTRMEAMQALIAEGRGEDPLIGVKLGSELGLQDLLERLATDRGVHAETLMARAGVLMGLSAQASLWAEAHQSGEKGVVGLHHVRCQDDSSYVLGEPLNRRLIEGYASPWELLGEAAGQEGCPSLPEAQELLLAGIQRLCTPRFGCPAVPSAHAPMAMAPGEQVGLWEWVRPLCLSCCMDPREWPLLCGLIAARALRLVSPQLSASVAFRLAMDAAIDAAKIPLEGSAPGKD